MASVKSSRNKTGPAAAVMRREAPGLRLRIAAMPASDNSRASDLDHLFHTEAPGLLRYFHRKTGDRDVASDLVQDTFLRMLVVSQSGLCNPASYLQRIARNLLFDRWRRRSRSPQEMEIPFDERLVRTAPGQEEALDAQDLLRLYEAGIAGLSEKTRTIFLLQRVDGLTYDQIRQQLGISMGSVEYHMMRAIAHLNRVLEDR